ncbi:hypothetical protein ACK6TA_12165, partial [Escherichia coli]
HYAFSSGAGRTSDGNGSHASTLKSPSYTKSVSWQHYPQHQYPTNPSESESASSSDHYYFAIFWVFAVMFFPFWFFHQGSNFCRACKSGVCISAIYLLDLFLFSDKIFSIAVFSFFFTFTIFMVFTCLCVLQKRASGRSYHSDNSGSAGGSDSGGFSGGGGSSGGGGASGRW